MHSCLLKIEMIFYYKIEEKVQNTDKRKINDLRTSKVFNVYEVCEVASSAYIKIGSRTYRSIETLRSPL